MYWLLCADFGHKPPGTPLWMAMAAESLMAWCLISLWFVGLTIKQVLQCLIFDILIWKDPSWTYLKKKYYVFGYWRLYCIIIWGNLLRAFCVNTSQWGVYGPWRRQDKQTCLSLWPWNHQGASCSWTSNRKAQLLYNIHQACIWICLFLGDWLYYSSVGQLVVP